MATMRAEAMSNVVVISRSIFVFVANMRACCAFGGEPGARLVHVWCCAWTTNDRTNAAGWAVPNEWRVGYTDGSCER